MAAGVGPGVLLAALQPSSSTTFKTSAKVYQSASTFQGTLTGKVPVLLAPAPAVQSAISSLPSEWLVVTSAAEWFDQNRQAAAAGALLATVFVSDKAARAHGTLLESLRRNYGSGTNARVRFVFVHIADGYAARNAACGAAAAMARGPQGRTVGRVSHTAAVHGLDVALSSFLPDGIRSFPSLLLTAGPAAADGSAHWSAATRVEQLTQLVSDWAFITSRHTVTLSTPAHAAAVETAAVTVAAAAVPAPPETAVHARSLRAAFEVSVVSRPREAALLVLA